MNNNKTSDKVETTTNPSAEKTPESSKDSINTVALKAFIGKNYDYFADKWAISAKGKKKLASFAMWNWSAFLLGPLWLAYRKMYVFAYGILAIIAILLAIFSYLELLAALGVIACLALGYWGNFLYQQHTQNKVAKALKAGLSGTEQESHVVKIINKGSTSIFAAAIYSLIAAVMVFTLVIFEFQARQLSLIKNGHFIFCPNSSIEQMVNGYLDTPNWHFGVSKKGQLFVSVTGTLAYKNQPSPAVIDFFITGNQYKINSFTINNIRLLDKKQEALELMCDAVNGR